MTKHVKTAITPTRAEDYPEWYQQVVKASDMAENSPVRGCMVIKPWGYGIWENIMRILNEMFKATGVKNAYFPLFIPLSFLEKEAEHVEGFAKECAVVSHHRLEKGPNGGLVPAGPLNEPLIVRPTSETIIGDAFSKWISSYRDLPILINQWAAHATKEEAIERTHMMLDLYSEFVEQYLAMPVMRGKKSAAERFPGAVDTLCIEAMMQDRKALQVGTSHFLGQNFARASDIKFQSDEEKEEYAWTTSWGTSTRLIGGLIMAHSDDDGLVLPPKIASSHVVLLPIIRKADDRSRVMEFTESLARELKDKFFCGRRLEVEIDDREIGGARGWDWIKKGIPVRVEIGPRDIDDNSVFVGRRDRAHNAKKSFKRNSFTEQITDILAEIQESLFERALMFRKLHSVTIEDKKTFIEFFTPENKEKPEIHGGFASSCWCGSKECESKIKQELSVSIRCVPLFSIKEKGKCIYCGQPATSRVIFAKAY
jgi:prolyl-tRNA synthetase